MGDFAPLHNKIIDETHGQTSTNNFHEKGKLEKYFFSKRKAFAFSMSGYERVLKYKVKFKRYPQYVYGPKQKSSQGL